MSATDPKRPSAIKGKQESRNGSLLHAAFFNLSQMPDHYPASLKYRPALPDDVAECVVVRGRTRQNAASEEWLNSIGITSETWAENIRSGSLPGNVCIVDEKIVGFCFGVRKTGEIQVLAVLADYENRGIGRELLKRTTEELSKLGHARLFLGCSPDPASRSYGFYRHLGWRSTGAFDKRGDEILEILVKQ